MLARELSIYLWKSKIKRHISICVATIFLFLISIISYSCSQNPNIGDSPNIGDLVTIKGRIIDHNGPVPGAIVKLKTTEISVRSDEDGRFLLKYIYNESPQFITAWAKGYFIAGGYECNPGEKDINIFLEPYPAEDNPDYEWISAYALEGKSENCENCHSSGSEEGNLPFDQWLNDAHARSAENIRFLTMYSGTDIHGNQSPATVYADHPEYGSFPLSPDLNEPYFGPGYKLDFPNTSGNCASCHTPMAAVDDPYNTNPLLVEGVGKEGISCDFCHKILDVKLNNSTGNPNKNMPGVLSYDLRRPFDGHQFFSGPYDDVAPGEDVYSSIQKESQYCAPCHFGIFWDVPIYNSFGEWLASPYNNKSNGRTCQDCHMPAGLSNFIALEQEGGMKRNPEKIHSHRMLGVEDIEFMKNAVTMNTNINNLDSIFIVSVDIINDNTGHHIPTDSPLRQLILLIEARDAQDNLLLQIEGPTLPDWCGVGDPQSGYYAGLPGLAYAKILKEHWTEKEPTASYWMQTYIVSDNRIAAFETASSKYTFLAPENETASITVKLIFRRAFIELMDQKGWNDQDLVLTSESFDMNN